MGNLGTTNERLNQCIVYYQQTIMLPDKLNLDKSIVA